MKKQIPTSLTHLLSLSLLLLAASPAFAQSTAFTYNGRLNDKGLPVNGAYDMRFTIYDSDVGVNVIAGPLPVSPVNVANGLFTVRIDFLADVFTGPPRWLEVAVRPGGGGDFTTLTQRQEVTSSPYAIRAQTAGNVANGTVTANQLNTGGLAPAPGQFLSYNGGNLFWSDPGVAVGDVWSRNGTDAYYTAGNVGIGSVAGASKLQIAGANALTMTGPQPYLTWHDTTTARSAVISSAGGTLYYRVPDAGGTVLTAGYVDSNGMVTRGRLVVEGNNPYITWQDNASGRSATISTANGTLYYRVPNAANSIVTAGYVDSNGLVVNGRVAVTETVNAARGIVIGNNPGTIDAPIYSDTAASTRVVLYNTANSSLMDLVCRKGDVSTLTIRGGADLAEPFAMSQPDVEPGSVVVIDAANPGKLRLSTHAYDNKVAGIVSGANGINPGISMIQEDKLESGKNVALSGRVFVQADAANGPIEPGDLLTTSNTPGHAMRVTDHAKAQGAILGKAMSGLKEGKGMVLVLVTLQ